MKLIAFNYNSLSTDPTASASIGIVACRPATCSPRHIRASIPGPSTVAINCTRDSRTSNYICRTNSLRSMARGKLTRSSDMPQTDNRKDPHTHTHTQTHLYIYVWNICKCKLPREISAKLTPCNLSFWHNDIDCRSKF